MSLERKLPLMMTAVLVMILGVGVTLAYREVSMAGSQAAQQRIAQVSKQLADLVAAGRPRTETQLGGAWADPAVKAILLNTRRSPADIAAADTALAQAIAPGDSGVGVAVAAEDGRILASARSADMGVRWAEGVEEDLARPVSRSPVTSAFYVADDRIFYSTVLPIVDGKRMIGSLIQHRRLNSQPETERGLVGLTGQQAKILFRNGDGSLWLTLGGKEITKPSNPRRVGEMLTWEHRATGEDGRVLLAESAVRGMPWVVAIEVPISSLTAAPQAMLRRFLLFSTFLLLVGAVAMWFIGRRVTVPLAQLTVASEAIAGGDYSQRVETSGAREISRLAETFNRMAKGTADAQRALEDRFREARSLAEELEHANRRLRATTEAAEAAQAAAENANAAKSSFLAAMSHELRTPLNAIAGYVQLIQLGLRGPVTPEQEADLNRIKRSHAYLLGLIEDVLNFAKLDAHQMEFHSREMSLDEIMQGVENLLAPQIKAAGIVYSYSGCDSNTRVCADPDKTQQILVNLLTNAVKFTKLPGSITVSCETADDDARILVTDTGIGIREEDMARVFEPFVQIDRGLNRPRDGVGLGLTISRDFARRMGGDLVVASVPGEGSTFTLSLPRCRDVSTDNEEHPSTAEIAVA